MIFTHKKIEVISHSIALQYWHDCCSTSFWRFQKENIFHRFASFIFWQKQRIRYIFQNKLDFWAGKVYFGIVQFQGNFLKIDVVICFENCFLSPISMSTNIQSGIRFPAGRSLLLTHAEIGPNDHREGANHIRWWSYGTCLSLK